MHPTDFINEETTTMLVIEFGYEAIGLAVLIMDKIAHNESPINEVVLCKQLNIKKRLKKQLDFMVEIGVFSRQNGEILHEKSLKNAEKYLEKKEKNAKRVSQFRERQSVDKNVTHYSNVTKPLRNDANTNISKYKEREEEEEEASTPKFSKVVKKKTKIELAQEFYEKQIEPLTEPMFDSEPNYKAEYIKIFDFLFGKYKSLQLIEKVYVDVLQMKDQLDFKSFYKLNAKICKTGKCTPQQATLKIMSFIQKIDSGVNKHGKNYTDANKSLPATILNWIDFSFKRKAV